MKFNVSEGWVKEFVKKVCDLVVEVFSVFTVVRLAQVMVFGWLPAKGNSNCAVIARIVGHSLIKGIVRICIACYDCVSVIDGCSNVICAGRWCYWWW